MTSLFPPRESLVCDIPAAWGWEYRKTFFYGDWFYHLLILLTCGGEKICGLGQETEDTKRHPAKKKKDIKFRRKTLQILLSEKERITRVILVTLKVLSNEMKLGSFDRSSLKSSARRFLEKSAPPPS
jgi:hypothetical protein